MIRTTVKTLTGDVFSVEHHSGALEQGLRDAINRTIPEFYSECQKIIYPEGGDNTECYVIVDTVKDTVDVEMDISPIPVYLNTKRERMENYDINEFLDYVVNKIPFTLSYNVDTYEESPIHNIIKCKQINIYWTSKNVSGKTGGVSFIYHPSYGFSSTELMHDRFIENNSFLFLVPNSKKYPEYWFPTFTALKNFIEEKGIRRFPYIFSSEDFIDKIREKFETMTSSNENLW